MTADSEGRWFLFRLSGETRLIIEKRTVPDHLKGLDCLESAVPVSTILRELEDIGEATRFFDELFSYNVQQYLLTFERKPIF